MIGDILLIQYRWDIIIGGVIRWLTKSPWNHVAWILNDKVFEVKFKGIHVTPIKKYDNKFLYKTKTVRIKGNKIDKGKLEMALISEAFFCGYMKRSYFEVLWNYIKYVLGLRSTLPSGCANYIACHLADEKIYFNKNKNPMNITPGDVDKSEIVYEV